MEKMCQIKMNTSIGEFVNMYKIQTIKQKRSSPESVYSLQRTKAGVYDDVHLTFMLIDSFSAARIFVLHSWSFSNISLQEFLANT